MLTNRVVCDNCGAVIVDGTVGTESMFNLDAFGNPFKNGNYNNNRLYGDGVGLLNTLVYGAKKKVLCRECQRMEKQMDRVEGMAAKENAALADQRALQQENLLLQNELLKQKLQNETRETRSTPIAPAPAITHTAPAVRTAGKFCTNCGTRLKQNANFCTKCGTNIR